MNIASVNNHGGSAKHVRESFMNVNNSISKLSSGKKYNSIGEGVTEQNMARSLNIAKDANNSVLGNIKEAGRVLDFAHATLSTIQDLLQKQFTLVSIASNPSSTNNTADFKTQLDSLQEQIKDSINVDYNGWTFFKSKALSTAEKTALTKAETELTTKKTEENTKMQELIRAETALAATPNNATLIQARNSALTKLETAKADRKKAEVDAARIRGQELKFRINASSGDPLTLIFDDISDDKIYRDANGDKSSVSVSVSNSAEASASLDPIKYGMEGIKKSLFDVVTAKARLDNVEKQIMLTVEVLESSYSDMMDVDVAEISNKLVKDILKVNTAALAQVHSNNTLRELVLTLTGGK